MPKVKILVDAVGEWNAGDIVTDAPPGLLHIALNAVRNAATGELLAEVIEEGGTSASEWEAREKNLLGQIEEAKAREVELLAQLAEKNAEDDELKALKATAKELKIAGYTKMSADELRAAIVAAGGAGDGE